jgi:hypothetical protein
MTTLIPKYTKVNTANRTIAEKFGETVSVIDYGADSTGVADSTTAFNAAIATGHRVLVPNGTYSVANVTLVAGTWITGETRDGAIITVRTNGAAAFLNAGGVYHIKIDNLTIKAGTGVTNAKGYNQTDLSAYSAWVEFNNIYTWCDLAISYCGFFIFTRWDSCQDGEAGTVPGGQYHQGIKSVPAATGQGNTTNNNQVTKCNFNNANDPNGAVEIEWGNLWAFRDCDFEVITTTALNIKGIFGVIIDGCWFENIAATQVIKASNSSAPGVQGSPDVSISNCYYNGSGNNTWFYLQSGAGNASIINLVAVAVASGCVLTDMSTVVSLTEFYGVTARSGAGAAGFTTGITATRSNLIITNSSLTAPTITSTPKLYTGAINGVTPSSTGINVNQGAAGGVILLTFTFSNSNGNATASSLYMIRCGFDGNNYTATKIVGDAGGAGAGTDVVTFSVVAGILHVAAASAGDASFGVIYTT